MDHYADDLAEVTAHLDLKNAIHVGHSTGGGEVTHYIARHGESRVAKAVSSKSLNHLMISPKRCARGAIVQRDARRTTRHSSWPTTPNSDSAESSRQALPVPLHQDLVDFT